MRPKKKTPDQRGVLLKEQPFTFRQRGDGSVEIFWKGRRVTVLTGKLAGELPRGGADRVQRARSCSS